MNHATRIARAHGRFGLPATLALGLLFGNLLLGGTTSAQEATPEVTPGVLETEADATLCAADSTATPPAGVVETFAITSEDSAVRHRAQEELASIGATEAVGETNAFIGQLLFDDAGMPVACSRFDADLRTLTSDKAKRDNYLYNNTLDSEQFPLATFILLDVKGLDAPLTDGEESTFTLIGNLTLHGVTREVAWEATAARDGDTISGDAWTTFEMPEFDIAPPVVGPVVSLDETVRLEVDITAALAS